MNVRWLCVFLMCFGAAAQNNTNSLFKPGIDDSAPPMETKEKMVFHAKRVVAPSSLFGSLLVAGVQQWEDTPGEWGRGIDGYAKRYANDLGRNSIRQAIYFGLDSNLHHDPRFHRSHRTSFIARAYDAAIQSVYTYKDGGGQTVNVGALVGSFGAGELAGLWMPKNAGTVGDGLVYGALQLVGDSARNTFREFWPDIRRKLGKK